MEGVIDCHSHFRFLTKVRGLMMQEKYGPVIGWNDPVTRKPRLNAYDSAVQGLQPASHRAGPYLPLIIEPRNFISSALYRTVRSLCLTGSERR
jgi:hypothetical protein